jgi:outer membrane protein
MKLAFVAAGVALVLAGAAQARNLVEVYDDAVQFDPQIHEADATRMAARESSPQALAALLPQISGNWSISRTKEETDSVEAFPNPANAAELLPLPFSVGGYTDERQYNLQLQQSVFSWANWKTLSKAHKQVAQAEARRDRLFQCAGSPGRGRCAAGRAHGRQPAAGAGQQAL